MPNKIVRKNHFVPQFFLKSFSQKGRSADVINVFDKKSINQIGSTIGTHVGSGTVGVVYFKK